MTLAETLGMDTCAEGVETHDDLQLIRELGVSMVQGYIFGRPSEASVARELANSVRVEADGFACTREPRHRLMRRAMTCIDGQMIELKLRNISSMGALVECPSPYRPATELGIDIVGVGPCAGSSAGLNPASSACSSKGSSTSAASRRRQEKRRSPMLTPCLPRPEQAS